MSSCLMTAIGNGKERLYLSETDVAILVRLADCADDDGFYISPSIDYLIKKTRFHQTSIRQALKFLGARGFLLRVVDCSVSPPYYGFRINAELFYAKEASE